MAIATALPGFDDLGSSVALIFFLFWWKTFFTNFLRLAKKWRKSFDYCAFCKKKIKLLLIRSFNFFLQNAPLNSARYTSSLFICAAVFVSWKLWQQLAFFTQHWDTLLQNMTEIVCLRWVSFDIFNYSRFKVQFIFFLPNILISLQVFQRMARCPLESTRFIVEDALYLWNEVGDSQFFCISDTRNS